MSILNNSQALNYLKLGATLSCLTVSSFAYAQQQTVDEIINTDEAPLVSMEHVYGKANIKTWNKNQVQISGTLGSLTEEFTFKKRGNKVVIDVEVKNNHYRWEDSKDAKDNLTVYVPVMSKLAYETVNADVDISGVQGGASIEVVNGDIEANDLAGRVTVESVNGDISLSNVVGPLEIESINGDLEAEHKSNDTLDATSVNGSLDIESDSSHVKLETVNGNSSLVLSNIDVLSMSSVNGNALVSLTLNKGGDVDVGSVGGSITLEFNNEVSARFEVEAHAGGKLINRINDAEVRKAKYGPGKWLDFTEGDGDGRVQISTVHGRVTLKD